MHLILTLDPHYTGNSKKIHILPKNNPYIPPGPEGTAAQGLRVVDQCLFAPHSGPHLAEPKGACFFAPLKHAIVRAEHLTDLQPESM